MHDGTVTQGDNWIKTYLPILTGGPNYQAGNTAIFIMWDEGSDATGGGGAIPSVIIAPSIPAGTVANTTTNNIGLLKTTQDALNIKPYLGCASGTAPGGGSCNPGSTASLVSQLNL
jgi:hypothetical protein